MPANLRAHFTAHHLAWLSLAATAAVAVLCLAAGLPLRTVHAGWSITSAPHAAALAAATPSAPAAAPSTATAAVAPQSQCTPLNFGTPSGPDLAVKPTGLSVQTDSPTWYRVYGNTAADLRNQVERCAPDTGGSGGAEFSSETAYSLVWQYNTVAGDGGCTLSNLKVGLHTAIALPYWQPTGSAVAGLAGRWQSFATGLAAHEQGHADIDKTYAARLLSDLNALGSLPCGDVTSDVSAVANADVTALNHANDAYDSATNHGATQGAVMPTY